MEFLTPIAELLGVTAGQLTAVAVVFVVLVVGWYVLRATVRIAARTFTTGCFVIILIGVGLYLLFVII